MKTPKLHKLATAVGTMLALGLASQAYAGEFTIDPSVLGSAELPFNGNLLNGSSSELLRGDVSAQTLTATSGWLNFTGISLNGNPVLPGISGLGNDYQLYATFSLVASLTSGTFAAAGSEYALTSLMFELWGDSGLDTIFNQANAGSNTEATVTVGTADTLLGSGSLIAGVAEITDQFGAALNATTTYANTTDGNLFFPWPVPFHNISFNGFNNTGPGVSSAGDCSTAGSTSCRISITQAAGVVDFATADVPEPGTLGLFGLGLLGMASLRKRKTA